MRETDLEGVIEDVQMGHNSLYLILEGDKVTMPADVKTMMDALPYQLALTGQRVRYHLIEVETSGWGYSGVRRSYELTILSGPLEGKTYRA